MPVLYGRSANGRPLGTAPTISPSQVGNLTLNSITSSGFRAGYTAAVGTAPITYAGQTSPHGGGTWTANSGTFGATGGNFVGLSASANYDVRIIATNAAGSSTTSYLAGVTTADPVVVIPPSNDATRFDALFAASTSTVGAARTLTLTPNGNWTAGSITPSVAKGAGSFSPTSVTPVAGSNTAVTVDYAPSAAGEHAVSFASAAGLYTPYPAPLNVFPTSSGTARTIAGNLKYADRAQHQRDTASGNPAGFSFGWARGWGEVPISLSSISGATDGLWAKLIDADSSGASSTLGTGTYLNTSPVQVYGPVSTTGIKTLLLPAGPYVFYLELSTDAAFSNPIRLSRRFGVGLTVGIASRSQESGWARGYAYNSSVSVATVYSKSRTFFANDYRYPNDGGGAWFSHVPGTTDPNSYSEPASAGTMEYGRIVNAKLGVTVGLVGISATSGGLDQFVNHDGSMSSAFVGTVNSACGGKFRHMLLCMGNWDGVDGAYPSETFAESRTRYIAACDWIPRNFKACAVIGGVTSASGWFGDDGSRSLGYTRLQGVFLNELEPAKPHVVSKESYNWNEFAVGHSTMGAREQYVRSGARLMFAAELAVMGGDQTPDRGPTLAATGTIASGSRVIRIPYTLHGGTALQAVGISFTDPNFTYNSATTAELASLFSVYQSGSYKNNGQPIKIDSAAINSGLGTIDLTLTGSSGITYADNSTATMPSAFSVMFAADFGASNGTVRQSNPNRAIVLCDDRSDLGIGMGWHMRPKLDIAVSTV